MERLDPNKYGQDSDEARQYQYLVNMANRQIDRGRPDMAQMFLAEINQLAEQLGASAAFESDVASRTNEILSNFKPLDVNQYKGFTSADGNLDYYTAANMANRLMASGQVDRAREFIDAANQIAVRADEYNRKTDIKNAVPFGTGFGQALGYDYGIQNAYGDVYQKFDAQGNLTEYLDKNGNWVKTSVIKPSRIEIDEGGNPVTYYKHPDFDQTEFTADRKYAPMMSPYREDQGGFLGEGGWQNIGKLVLAGVSAGLAAPAMAAIQGATGLGTIASGALYGGLTGAASGALGGGAQGALQGGLLGAAGGGAMAALGGGGAEAFPVEAPSADFTGMSYADLNSLGVGEFQPFAGGDVGLGSGYITQFNPDGTFTTLAGAPDYSYTADAGAEAGEVVAEEFDPNARVLTAEEAENLMRYNILPADMQTPAVYDWLETPKALLGGEYGGLIKGGLTLGALAAANALKPQQETQTTGGGLTAAQLQALVSTMPSMIDQYAAQAQQGLAGMGQTGQGYTPAMGQAIAQLFPTFSLPTTGPFYGAGRFGEGYAPTAPIIKV